jgi:hypothetical protein
MDLKLQTESTIDPNAVILLTIGLLVAGAGIVLIAKLAR